jgi:NAD(P)-dependent dehydrogenase (short-subunit alcohol dehydrogenase family)
MTPALLRPGLLDGVAVLVAGEGVLATAAADRSGELGATVTRLEVDPAAEAPPEHPGEVHQLVWDGAGAFAVAGTGVDAVRAALDGAWLAVRAVAPERARKVVLLAPPAGDPHAEAVRAGLENLARTLSIEWARYGVTLVAIHPGPATTPATVAELCAFLASPAGDYHSGSVVALSP